MKIYLKTILFTFYLTYGHCENFKLLILHNNDMHSRFEETSQSSGVCETKKNCYGGFARVMHVVREARKAAQDGRGPPVVYLNAGDTYTGSVWFTVHKWKIAADFLNMLHPDVSTFGNHEFDHKPKELVPFLKAVSYPIVAANVDFTKDPQYDGINITKSFVLNVKGKRIGVIGYILPETSVTSSPGDAAFFDEIDAIKEESERLDKEGIKIIIALGHSGIEKDKEIAQNVPLVDIVIGGHTDTFLWNGPKPDEEKVEGPYPIVMEQSSGKKVPVVQAYAYTKYMGRLNVEFDDNGNLVEFSGQPQLLDGKIPQDLQALDLLERYRPAVDAVYTEVIGTTRVVLDGNLNNCRTRDCNLGNFIADAYVAYHASQHKGKYWTDAPIAMLNGGAVRKTIIPRKDETLTKSDILAVLPYIDDIYTVTLNGSHLKETLEIGVRYDGDTTRGELIQTSGIHYEYDQSKPVGSRIISAKVRCARCNVPLYEPLDVNNAYRVIVTGFLLKGGDGHNSIKDNAFNIMEEDKYDSDIVTWFVTKRTPIYPEEEERIKGVNILQEGSQKGSGNRALPKSIFIIFVLVAITFC